MKEGTTCYLCHRTFEEVKALCGTAWKDWTKINISDEEAGGELYTWGFVGGFTICPICSDLIYQVIAFNLKGLNQLWQDDLRNKKEE